MRKANWVLITFNESNLSPYAEIKFKVADNVHDANYHLKNRDATNLETGKIPLADLTPRVQQLRHQQDQLHATRLDIEQQLADQRIELADAKTVAAYVADLHDLVS